MCPLLRSHPSSLTYVSLAFCPQLCEKSQTCHSPAFRQIQLDLHRTLTTNQRFSSPSSSAHQQLCRILQAFSWHNPAIGYCQGLNRYTHMTILATCLRFVPEINVCVWIHDVISHNMMSHPPQVSCHCSPRPPG